MSKVQELCTKHPIPVQFDFEDDRPGELYDRYFNNGYKVTIARHGYSLGGPQGLYELGLWKFMSYGDYDMECVEGITAPGDTVVGFLNDEEVISLMDKVSELPSCVIFN